MDYMSINRAIVEKVHGLDFSAENIEAISIYEPFELIDAAKSKYEFLNKAFPHREAVYIDNALYRRILFREDDKASLEWLNEPFFLNREIHPINMGEYVLGAITFSDAFQELCDGRVAIDDKAPFIVFFNRNGILEVKKEQIRRKLESQEIEEKLSDIAENGYASWNSPGAADIKEAMLAALAVLGVCGFVLAIWGLIETIL